MKKPKLKTILIMLAVGVALLGVLSIAPQFSDPAFASSKSEAEAGINATGAGGGSVPELISAVVRILAYIVGAVAVIMIIIAGLRYVTSNGDSGQISSAKTTLIYAIVGLVIALFAQPIVNFVLGYF